MMRLARDVGIGLLLAALLLGLLEAVLWALGIGAPLEGTEPREGFSAEARYIVPDPDKAGAWRTQFLWDQGGVETPIARRKRRLQRVLMMGGSNMRSFMAGRLSEKLHGIDGPHEYEVINLGRSGYGSERVLLILRQALDHLRPDLIVLYTGDNEFVEDATRADFRGELSLDWLHRAPAAVRRLRTVNALARAFAGRAEHDPTLPEPWKPDPAYFAELTYEQGQERLEVLRENLRTACRIAQERGVDVVLCTVIYNRLAAPHVSTACSGLDVPQGAELARELARAEELLPQPLRMLLPIEGDEKRLRVTDWGRFESTDRGLQPHLGLDGRRPCFGPLADADPLMPDSARWTPRVVEVHRALEWLFARDPSDAQRAALEEAERALGRALELCPDHPRALFALGLVELVRGRDARSWKARFEAAASADRAPRKSSERINDLIRSVAAEFPEVLLFDADGLFAERFPDGLVGWEWMMDHCHLQVGARHVIMADLARFLFEEWDPPLRTRGVREE